MNRSLRMGGEAEWSGGVMETPIGFVPEGRYEGSDSTELAEVLSDEAQALYCRPLMSASQARRAPQPGRGRSRKDEDEAPGEA
jgi:hypothetical protein